MWSPLWWASTVNDLVGGSINTTHERKKEKKRNKERSERERERERKKESE